MSLHRVNHRPTTGRAGAHPVRTLGMAITVAAVFAATGTTFSPMIEVPVLASDLGTTVAVPAVYVSPMADVDAVTWEGAQLRSDPADGEGVAGLPGGLSGQNLPVGISNDSTYLPAAAALPGGLSFIHPVTSRHITSPYGWRHNPTGPGMQIHIGQDYAQTCGAPVRAAADGVVIQSAWAGHSGQRVTIDHGDGIRTGYSHNSQLIARVGDRVKQGQIISLVGSTGNSTGCHLHLEVIINGRWVDPRNYLPIIPGQSRPLVDSSNTTVAAEPITNTGAPRANNPGHGDRNAYLPAIARPPAASAPAKHEGAKKPSKPSKQSKPAAPTETPKPSNPKPTPKPTKASSSPDADKTPLPTKGPAKPSPTPSASPTPSTIVKPSATPTPSPTPSTTESPAPTATPNAKPSPTPSATPTPTPSVSPTPSATPSPTPTPSATPTPPPSATPTATTPKPTPSSALPTSSSPAPTAEPTGSPAVPPTTDPTPPKKSELPAGSVCELETGAPPEKTDVPAPDQQAKENGDPETGIVSEDGFCLPPAEPVKAAKAVQTPPARKDS